MGSIIERKDKTSIFCPASHFTRNHVRQKAKVIELTLAVILILSGAYIMLLPH